MRQIIEKKDGVILLTTSKGTYSSHELTITIAPDSNESQEIRKKLEFSSNELWLRDSMFKALIEAFKEVDSITGMTEIEEAE